MSYFKILLNSFRVSFNIAFIFENVEELIEDGFTNVVKSNPILIGV